MKRWTSMNRSHCATAFLPPRFQPFLSWVDLDNLLLVSCLPTGLLGACTVSPTAAIGLLLLLTLPTIRIGEGGRLLLPPGCDVDAIIQGGLLPLPRGDEMRMSLPRLRGLKGGDDTCLGDIIAVAPPPPDLVLEGLAVLPAAVIRLALPEWAPYFILSLSLSSCNCARSSKSSVNRSVKCRFCKF